MTRRYQILLGLCGVILTAGLWWFVDDVLSGFESELGRVSELTLNPHLLDMDETTVIYDNAGTKIGELSGKRRYVIDVGELSKDTVHAFLAAEDSNFYSHPGFDVGGIFRAALANLKARKTVQGASTLTQQVARSFFLTSEKTYYRKFRELLLAIQIERQFSKRDILGLYLNKIYFGNGAYGIEAAAKTYFRKPASKLFIHEAALLAALPKAPSRLSPSKSDVSAKAAMTRQRFILKRMLEEGFITESAYESASKNLVRLYKSRPEKITSAPYFVTEASFSLKKYLDQSTLNSGLEIHTSLDQKAQELLQRSLAKRFNFLKTFPDVDQNAFSSHANYSGVTLDVKSGRVIALVGGKDFTESQFNRALYTTRPMGNMVLPFLTLLSLERGDTLFQTLGRSQTTIYDALTSGDVYSLASQVSPYGFGAVKNLLQRSGVPVRRNDMDLLLGNEKMSAFDIARLFAFMSDTKRQPVSFQFVDRVTDKSGTNVKSGERERLLLKLPNPTPSMTKPGAQQNMSALVFEALKSTDCYSSYQSSGDSQDDYYSVDFNLNYVSVQWFGSEKGMVKLPKLSSGNKKAFKNISSAVADLPCKSMSFPGVSYYSVNSKNGKKWAPFYAREKKTF